VEKQAQNRLTHMTRLVTRAFTATVGGLAVLAGTAVWISMPQYDNYLQAILWATGLVFLALTVEARRPLPFALTGLVLPVIAWLSYQLATEWAMVGAGLLAAWLVFAVYRRQ
jgi:hypothetical protein